MPAAPSCLRFRANSEKPSSADNVRVIESGRLVAEPGFTGKKYGVEVERIMLLDDSGIQAIDLSLPFASDRVDEIEVISNAGETIEQQREADIETGPDPKNTGVRLFLPRRKNWEFRLRIIDVPEDQ